MGGVGYLANVCGTGAATAADNLRSIGEPIGCHAAEPCGGAVACPSPGGGVPALTGVGVDDNWFVGGGAQLGDQRGYESRPGAVDSDGYGLRKARDNGGAGAEYLAVGHVLYIPAGEGEPGCQIGPGLERLGDGLRLFKRRESLKGQQAGGLGAGCGSQHINPLAMELNQIGECAAVVAVVLGSVVEGGAVRSERRGPHHPAQGA